MPLDRNAIVSPHDPRLARMGDEDVAGEDQIAAMLAATPDERLDNLESVLKFITETRQAIRERR